MRSGLISLPTSLGQIGRSSFRNRIQLLAIAIMLADRFAVKQWHKLGRASLGRRVLCVTSIGVLWLWVRWWREILQF